MHPRLTNCCSRIEPEPPPLLYAWLARGTWFGRIYQRYLGDLAGSQPQGARLLDVGTGPGVLMGQINRKRPDLSLVGLDKSYGMISQARRLSKGLGGASLAWVVGRAEALPFPSAFFDLVLATMSLHHWDHPVAAVVEIVRVLKPQGRAWIYELNRDASLRDITNYAREEKLPPLLVYLVFNFVRWHSALKEVDFAQVFHRAGVPEWQLQQVHHIFWRAEIQIDAFYGRKRLQ